MGLWLRLMLPIVQCLWMLMEPSTRVKSQSAGKVSGCENWVVISTAQNPRLHWRESHTLTNIATISTICQPFALSWTVLDVCLAILTLASGVKVLQLCIPHQPKHASGVSQGMSIYHEKRSSYPWKETSSRQEPKTSSTKIFIISLISTSEPRFGKGKKKSVFLNKSVPDRLAAQSPNSKPIDLHCYIFLIAYDFHFSDQFHESHQLTMVEIHDPKRPHPTDHSLCSCLIARFWANCVFRNKRSLNPTLGDSWQVGPVAHWSLCAHINAQRAFHS